MSHAPHCNALLTDSCNPLDCLDCRTDIVYLLTVAAVHYHACILCNASSAQPRFVDRTAWNLLPLGEITIKTRSSENVVRDCNGVGDNVLRWRHLSEWT